MLRLGQSYLEAARLPRLVLPFIQRVSMQCGETVNVSVLDGHDVVYIARSNSPRVVSIGYHAGARIPAHVVTPGIVMVGTFSDAQLDSWIAAHDFSGFTAHTVTDPAVFRKHVLAARALGHGMAEQQLDLGLRGIAVVLRGHKGDCVGALSMTLQSQAYTIEQTTQRLLPLLIDTAQSLRNLL